LFYFDTSFLTPLIKMEATSAKIDAFVRDLAGDQLTVSHWGRVEFSSLLFREVRMGRMDSREAADAEARFDTILSLSFSIIAPVPNDFDRAKHYLRRFETGLRAGDALHLAMASNHGARMIYSLDKGLVKAGEILGLPRQYGHSGGVSFPTG
jgi:predicted nucleic acid-binding protein